MFNLLHLFFAIQALLTNSVYISGDKTFGGVSISLREIVSTLMKQMTGGRKSHHVTSHLLKWGDFDRSKMGNDSTGVSGPLVSSHFMMRTILLTSGEVYLLRSGNPEGKVPHWGSSE